jgi:hypothetical protein
MIIIYKNWKLDKTFKDKEMSNMNDVKEIYMLYINNNINPQREILWDYHYNYNVEFEWKIHQIKLHKYTECIYQAIMRYFWIELRSF